MEMRYAAVIEQAVDGTWSAIVPGLACYVVGLESPERAREDLQMSVAFAALGTPESSIAVTRRAHASVYRTLRFHLRSAMTLAPHKNPQIDQQDDHRDPMWDSVRN